MIFFCLGVWIDYNQIKSSSSYVSRKLEDGGKWREMERVRRRSTVKLTSGIVFGCECVRLENGWSTDCLRDDCYACGA